LSFLQNYKNFYTWKVLSIFTGFLSLFIVVPHITNNQELFGIYSFCISFTLYLSYADIGFLNAGQKFAAEEYIKGNRIEEINILGFTGAILLLMILPFSIGMIWLSFNPEFLIFDLTRGGQEVAGKLFFIIGIFTPLQLILQRLIHSILAIRIEDFVALRIEVFFNIIKVFSVYYFFNKGRYMIVEYFTFITIISMLSSIIVLFIIRVTKNYDFIRLIKAIRLKRKYWAMTKNLAFSSFFSTIGFILYYELDLIIVGKIYGVESVAIYAIGFTFLNFLRTFWNTIFAPYQQRFNHFIAKNHHQKFKTLMINIIDYSMPLCFITITILYLIADEMVVLWVGSGYTQSIVILKTLMIGTVFTFITHPAKQVFSANLNYKYVYLSGIALPLTFFICLFLIMPIYGMIGVAISKTLAIFIGFLICLWGISSSINPLLIFKKWFFRIAFTLIILSPLIINSLLSLFSIDNENSLQLISLIILTGFTILILYLSILMTSKKQRMELSLLINNL